MNQSSWCTAHLQPEDSIKDRLLDNIFQNCVSKTLVFHEKARKNTFSLKEKTFS